MSADPHAEASAALVIAANRLRDLATQAEQRGGVLAPFYDAMISTILATIDAIDCADDLERLDTPKVLDEVFGPNMNHSLRAVV